VDGVAGAGRDVLAAGNGKRHVLGPALRDAFASSGPTALLKAANTAAVCSTAPLGKDGFCPTAGIDAFASNFGQGGAKRPLLLA
jgi:hypothetical protein